MSTPSPLPLRRQRGAALLLLLVVLGLGASALLISSFSPGNDSARQQRSAAQVAEAREALLGFAMVHGRLPRPAISAQDGREQPDPCSDDGCTGYLPWVTLGVSGSDAWGKLLRYSVSPGFARRIVPNQAVAEKRILGRDGQGQPYYVVGGERCDVGTLCATAVIFSSGKNNLGTSELGVPQANNAEGNLDEQHNDRATLDFFARPLETRPQAPGGEFDDIIAWIPLQLLDRKLEASGVLNKK
ncbi:type II secretory pathway pseudopilin PulG [Duganella sp. 1224]|uniref:hypothetical protein n=1 Tax=Duganella sp. 1224 TaxID=2587052 RepID=UPI0015CCABF9|nr:hypothetical protein [Duganella sp. 1224]NYE62171.1 type II secretory pathway pseudopilin PulG [Duganella sp. 1224]